MNLYPPLTPQQFATLNETVFEIGRLKTQVIGTNLDLVEFQGDEDKLLQQVSELRGHVQTLDLALFRIYGLVHRLKCSNVPTTLVQPVRRPPPTLDTLEDMLR